MDSPASQLNLSVFPGRCCGPTGTPGTAGVGCCSAVWTGQTETRYGATTVPCEKRGDALIVVLLEPCVDKEVW